LSFHFIGLTPRRFDRPLSTEDSVWPIARRSSRRANERNSNYCTRAPTAAGGEVGVDRIGVPGPAAANALLPASTSSFSKSAGGL
jgi:hypothetical protein